MEQPRAHICLVIPEHDLDIHLDLVIEEGEDVFESVIGGFVAFVTMLKANPSVPVSGQTTVN